MLTTKKLLVRTLFLLAVFYLLICIFLYLFQEKFIFFPDKLGKDYHFSFNEPFKEIAIETNDGKSLHGLLFTSANSKGLIFYLHGNVGSLASWGDVARTYTQLGYDVFQLDYRGYGKSEGTINNQSQLFEDVQLAYYSMKKRYAENNIIVLGYSIGTGPAAHVASVNHPKLLILQAPYYSLSDLMKHSYPLIPTFLLKYKLTTNKYIRNCSMPVIVFHGDKDGVISYGSALKLKEEMKPSDMLITLNGQGHNGITSKSPIHSCATKDPVTFIRVLNIKPIFTNLPLIHLYFARNHLTFLCEYSFLSSP